MTGRGILTVELTLAVILGVTFSVLYGWPWRARDPAMAWHIASFAAVSAVEAEMLMLVLMGVPVPAWVVIVVYAGMNLVLAWRLGLLLMRRRPDRRVEPMLSTQSKHPVRASLRTTAAIVVALLPVLPEIVGKLGIATVPVVAVVLGIAAAVTRVLAIPAVEIVLRRFVPWLAAQPLPAPPDLLD